MSLSVDSAAGFSPYTGWMLKGISRIKKNSMRASRPAKKTYSTD